MKRLGFLLLIIPAIFFAGCQTDPATEVADGKYLTVSIEKTRTSLGDKKGNSYPVYWSADDQIVVNGELSGRAQIDSDNKGKASFSLSDNAEYPYLVTYPHCTSTTATAPVVEFAAEQSYTEGSFSANCAPMCGYAEKGQNVALKHLATILRLPVKSIAEGVTLEKVVVTSSAAKLAGEFSVDCQNGTITPTDEATSSVTYTVNQTLSTSTETVLYISLPAVNAGSCTLEFIDSKGGKMSGKWSAGMLNGGVVKEFKCVEYGAGATLTLEPMGTDEDSIDIPYLATGSVKDSAGNPIAGVMVSDGFSVATTNSEGIYTIGNVSTDAWYIYISMPAEYKLSRGEYGLPCFYQKYDVSKKQYDFILEPLANGKEDKFALFVVTDIHITSQERSDNFKNKVVPHINKLHDAYAQKGIPTYGVNLGDNITNYNKHNTSAWRDDILDGLTLSKVPVFSVFGNHDSCYFDSDQPLYIDKKSSTFNLKAQREFEDMFGPVNYSFNRGDVHVVCMRNILYTNSLVHDIKRGFMLEQYEWLEQDLANVPKDKMVVLCVHHQMYDSADPYCQEVLSLLAQFKEAHIMSGHGHIQRNTKNNKHNGIYEHVTCAISGPVWTFDMCGDGTPAGYQIFETEGNTFSDWYYISYLEGRDTRNSQLHLYRGNAKTGAAISGSNSNGTKGYYQFNFSENTILANIYNADSRWKILVYEDDEYSGEMIKLSATKPDYSTLIGDGTFDNPFHFADDVVTGYDFYVGGYHLGVMGRKTSHSGAWSQCTHMYRYELKNKNAKVRVEVTDSFGKVYTKEEFVDGTTYSF